MQQISTKLKSLGFSQRDIVGEVTKLLEIEEKMTKECQTQTPNINIEGENDVMEHIFREKDEPILYKKEL